MKKSLFIYICNLFTQCSAGYTENNNTVYQFLFVYVQFSMLNLKLFNASILGVELRSAGSSARSEPSGTRDIVKKVDDLYIIQNLN